MVGFFCDNTLKTAIGYNSRRVVNSLEMEAIGMRFLPLIVLMALALGCVKPVATNTAHLQGRITINGNDLPQDAEGYIQFMTTKPGQAPPVSVQIQDSTFDAEGVPTGPLNVIFNITRLTGRMVREDNAPGATPYPEREDLVPPAYRAGFAAEVTGDDDGFHFEL